MNPLNYWFFMATFYLGWLTWQDYTNNMLVDDRRNWFMLGLSISVLSHVYTPLYYKLALSFIIIGLNFFLKKSKAVGEADINTLNWIFLGFGLMHYSYITAFVIVFTVLSLLWYILRLIIIRNNNVTQFYGVIFTAFIVTSWFLGGYKSSLLYLG